MNPFEMVVLIVAICVAGSVLRARMGGGRGCSDSAKASFTADEAATRAENERLRDELRTLKGRVATLERIATDGASALDREIEQLRDRP